LAGFHDDDKNRRILETGEFMIDKICCEITGVALPSKIPFGKILSFGWYDGTTSGMVQCSGCSAAFKYDIVDWDSDQDRRIFALSPIESDKFDQIVRILGGDAQAKWPFWVPRWEFDSKEERKRIEKEVDEHLATARRPEFLIVSDRNLSMMFGMRRLTGPARDRLPSSFDGLPITNDFAYWRDYIGLLE
jgi:hypothetical protein